jgi:class 3 adenylate cyclase
VAAEVERLPGISTAALLMATPANRELLERAGLLAGEAADAGPNDLVVAVEAADDATAEAALQQAARLLAGSGGATVEATELATLAHALFDELDMPAFEQQAGEVMARLSGTPTSRPPVVGAETAVILFTDIADSTALTEQLGDAAYVAKAKEFERSVRQAVRDSGGEDIEGVTLGDGVLAVFTSGTNAIEGAIRAHECAREAGFRLHVGIHAGDVLRTETGVHGGAVNIAARVCDAAPPGETLVSDTVRSLARTSVSVQFVDRGLHQFKGVSDPHQVFAVQVHQPLNMSS